MSTLLIRLAAPLQAWGVDAKFDRRLTERVPTKSGILGLAAAALGRRRNESLEELQALRFGVRVDRQGVLMRDYHTAKSVKAAYVTNRYYLSDAVFLAGLEGDGILLEEIEHALQHPVFPLFLGRRSCLPREGCLLASVRENTL
jgi:CRISPR system Cascade subunit CasD